MRINPNQISFTANIKFCNPQEFEQHKPADFNDEYPKNVDEFYKTQQAYKVRHPNEASWPWNIQSIKNKANLTLGKIFTCSAGGITGVNNHSTAARYHFVPEEPNINAIISENSPIREKLDSGIKAIGDNALSAFILGGETTEPMLKEDSKKLFTVLTDFFRKKNIDPSYFWGQDCSKDKKGVDAYYTANDDTWRVLKNKGNSDDVVSSIDDLLEAFSDVHLGKNDKLYFKYTEIPFTPELFNEIIRPKIKRFARIA
jgi:hypothetical protein